MTAKVRCQQLCSKAEQMLQQLDAQVDPAIASSTMLKFFAGKLYIIFLSLCIQFIIIFESIQFATPTLCSPVRSGVFDGKSMRQVELFNGFVCAKNIFSQHQVSQVQLLACLCS
jgi:hypothetical protein